MSNTKRNSVIDMINEGSSEELTSLKEFLELLKQTFDIKLDESERLSKRRAINQKLDDEYINSNISKILETCLERVSSSSSGANLTNKKSDLSLKILESLAEYCAEINNFDKVSLKLAFLLDKVFFERLTKLFQQISPEFSLKIVKVLIELLGKILHHNLSIINPLLQIMELAFKHVNNEIKSQCYDCWSYLIKNFALDRDFFFKPKKFNLILMPLLNKCKTYKDENVCRSKVLAWLCLIENINYQLPKYTSKVMIPFFNYCFGLNGYFSETTTIDDDGDESKQFEMKVRKFLGSKIQIEHEFQSLTQIGCEFLTVLIHNGDLDLLDSELRKKFIYVKTSQNYDIKKTLNDKNIWLCLMKYFFDIFLTNKTNQSNDDFIIVETWKQFCNLFNLNYKSNDFESDKDEEMIQEKQQNDCVYSKENLNDLVVYFMSHSVEFVNSFITSTKTSENRFIASFTKLILICFENEFSNYFSENEDFKSDLLKYLKKAANLILISDEENTNLYLNNLYLFLNIMENNHSLIDLFQWLHLSTKLYDHLRFIKTKTNQINLSERNYELVNYCIMFPFKHFKKLDILENDVKLVISSSTNIAKLFSGLVKQNRIKVNNFESSQTQKELQSINSWCCSLFSILKQKYTKSKSNDNSLIFDLASYWSELTQSLTSSSSQSIHPPTSYLIENTLKSLQLQLQFNLYILQNLFEFESINQIQDSTNDSSLSLIEKLASKKQETNNTMNLLLNLIDLIHKQIRLFYEFIKTQTNQSQINSKLNQEELDENLKKESNFEYSNSNSNSKQQQQQQQVIENKQPIQIYSFLIEQLSILFTRIKAYNILNELIINFASSFELIAELNYISRLTSNSTNNVSQSQSSSSQHISHLNSHYRYSSNDKIIIQLVSNRRSNDLYDTFSMQIASLVQNHLSKTYSFHQFDSALLEKLEPIFFSLLTYATKPNLKQKTLQAWNSTFGKSTVSSLKYSKRMETLFVEIREEMIDKSKSGSAGSAPGLFVISLPGFKPIDLTSNTTNSTYIQEPCDEFMHDEKENTPENLKSNENAQNLTEKTDLIKKDNQHHTKEFLNESNSSVPMVHFMSATNQSKNTQLQTKQTNETNIQPQTTLTTNFVFSPAGRNSFLNSINPNNNKSQSASKVAQLKTPEGKNLRPRQSPRSLNHNSKRKLDLNGLIDQAPDKDFVEIPKVNLSEKLDKLSESNKAQTQPGRKSTGSNKSSIKQPLTEHQKEVRKQKSFIPMEIQSVCVGLEATMDSQMSCSMMDDDTNTQQSQLSFSNVSTNKTNQNLSNETAKAIFQFKSITSSKNINSEPVQMQDENAIDIMEFDNEPLNKIEDVKENNEEKIDPFANQSVIKFHSKINPKKQIEVVQLNNTPESSNEELKNVDGSQEKIEINSNQKLEDNNEKTTLNENSKAQEENLETTKRRSIRLRQKEDSVQVTEVKNSISDELTKSVSSLNENLEEKLNQTEPKIDESNQARKSKRLTNIEKLKLRNNILKKSKKVALFKQKQRQQNDLNKNLKSLKYKNLIMKNLKQENNNESILTSKQFKIRKNKKKHLKKMKILEKINKEFNDSLKEDEKTKKEEEEKLSENLSNDVSMNIDAEAKVELVEDKKELETVELKVEIKQEIDEEDEDDKPLSQLIQKRKTTKIEETETNDKIITHSKKSDTQPIEPINTENPKQIQLEPLIEEETSATQTNLTNSSSKPKKTTEDLMHKLNNTPTTSILKKRISKIHESTDLPTMININPNLNQLVNNDTPNKRRVSFCESVQIEEIEPNFNKSLFSRSTPRIQNKAKIVLSPYFKNNSTNSPTANQQSSSITISSTSITTTTTTTSNITSIDPKTTSLSAPNTPLANPTNSLPQSRLNQLSQSASIINSSNNSSNGQLNSMSVPSSPSSSLINFFSNNKQNFLSQRASIIQQQMQGKSESSISIGSPLINKGLSQSLNLASNTTLVESPKTVNKTTIESSSATLTTSLDSRIEHLQSISAKLKSSKMSIEVLFDQIDTSIFMNKLGSYKYFKYKNILTIGDFCSLTPNGINVLPFKAPKIENYLNLIKMFEEKCSDLINKNSSATEITSISSETVQTLINENLNKPNVIMGSVEEEMEKLESTTCLDTSIECESLGDILTNQIQTVQEKINTIIEKNESNKKEQSAMDIDTEINNINVNLENDSINKLNIALDIFNKSLNEIKLDSNFNLNDLLDFSKQIDSSRVKITESLNHMQYLVRDLIKSKLTNS